MRRTLTIPRDGNGNYSYPNPPYVPQTVIDSAIHNANDADVAAALTQSWSRDGQSLATANWNLNAKRITNLGDPIQAKDAVTKEYVDQSKPWVLIKDVAATAVPNIDVTWTVGDYRMVHVLIQGVLPASAGATVNLGMRFRQNGSFVSGGTSYSTVGASFHGGGSSPLNLVGSLIRLTSEGTAAALDNVSGEAVLDPGGAGMEAGGVIQTRSSGFTLNRMSHVFGASLITEGAIDGIRFLWEGGGNFAAEGRIIVLGQRAAAVDSDILPAEPRLMQFACSDETTPIDSPVTDAFTGRAPYNINIPEVRASLNSACSTGTFEIDIKVEGISILSTPLTIDAGEETSTTAAVPAVVNVSQIADDAKVSVDVVDQGDGTATGLKVLIKGTA